MYTYGVTSNQNTGYGVAPPVYYTRFGSNLQVGPAPDQNYFYFFRVKLRHPWPSSSYASQTIFAPDSWQEVFEYAAILKLASGEGMDENSSICKTAMNFLKMKGMDPWTLRRLQMQRDETHNERQLTMRTTRYTFA